MTKADSFLLEYTRTKVDNSKGTCRLILLGAAYSDLLKQIWVKTNYILSSYINVTFSGGLRNGS